jgi:hypothetical protein
MTPKQEKIKSELQSLLELNKGDIELTIEGGTFLHSYVERCGKKPYVLLGLDLTDTTDANYDKMTTCIAMAYEALDNLRTIKKHDLDHPDFITAINNINKWNKL